MAEVDRWCDNDLERLRNAIIVQAAEDYRKAIREYYREDSRYFRQRCRLVMRRLDDFFGSEHYRRLCPEIDGDVIIKKLHEEFETERKERQ